MNKKAGDTPTADSDLAAARPRSGWRVWVAARPIALVSSAVYLASLFAILFGECPECRVPWKGAIALGSLLFLLLLDRLEYGLFGETPTRRVSLALLALRLTLTLAIAFVAGSPVNMFMILMLALIPYMGSLYFGNRGGIAVGVLVWVVGAANIAVASIPRLARITTYSGGESSTDYYLTGSFVESLVTGLAALTMLLVFVLVSARIASLERAHTGKAKLLLSQLETSHARLGIYSQQAIAYTEEHKRTAREIHDRLAHYLTAVSVQIELALAYREINPEKTEQAILSAKKAISKSLQDVRRSVAILRTKHDNAHIQDNEPVGTQALEQPTGNSVAAGGRARLWWLAPRPFDVITTTLYFGTFVMGSLESDTTWPSEIVVFGGLMLGLAVLDRIDFAVFRERPAWWVGASLLAVRITVIVSLIMGLIVGTGIWSSIVLFAIIPYWCTIYFGDKGGYIATALVVVLGSFLTLGGALEQLQRGSLDVALRDFLAPVLQVAFVLGVVAATSRTVLKETAGRATVEKVMGELQQAHADLADFSRQALMRGEARNSLARDIHDGLGHYLTAMSVQLEKAVAFRSIDPAAADQALHESKRLVAVALKEIRSTIGSLSESAGEFSPTDSLAELAEHMKHSNLSVHLTIEGSEAGYASQALMTLYRAAQEGLTNVQKHAGASQVDIKLRFGEEIATLEISDNGKGFAPEPAQESERVARHKGYGLQSMRERLELIGGELRVESEPGAGTVLRISVPRRSSAQAGQFGVAERVTVAVEAGS